jgi:spore germination protein YaaH
LGYRTKTFYFSLQSKGELPMKNKRNWLIIIVVLSILMTNTLSAFAAKNDTKKTPPPAPTLSYFPTAPTNGNVTVTAYFPSTAVVKQYRLGTNGVWTTYSAPIVLTYNVHVYIRYQIKTGEWSTLGGYPIGNIDKIPPSNPVFTISPDSPTNQNVTVTINYSPDSTVKQYRIGSNPTWLNYSAPIIVTSNDIIYSKASDSAGNWTPTISCAVTNIDKTPPDAPILTVDTTTPANEVVRVSISYPSDAKVKQYKIGTSGAWTNYYAPVELSSNGTIYARAQDMAGNWSAESVYTIESIDTTPPEKPVITPSTVKLTDMPVGIKIDYSTDSLIKQYKIGIDGIWMSYTSPIELAKNNTVYAKACDAAGNWSAEVSLVVNSIRKTVLGYTVKNYSTDVSSYNSIIANSNSINEIATATYSVDGLGNLVGTAPMDQINYANSNGIRTKLMVSNNFDASIAKQLLENAANRQTLKNNILNLLKTYNYKGVDIDIENVPAANRTHLTTFMSEIYSTLKPMGYTVSIAVQPKTYDSPNAAWNYAYDYKSLAAYSDFLMIMAYDEHYPGGQAGSIASIDWVKSIVDYTLTVVPKEKIILGLAAYGYDWVGTTTKAYSISSCYSLASQYGATVYFDNISKSKYFTYTVGGVTHTVWFEDADTIAYKLDLVNSRDLKGIGIWRLGLENANYWTVIRSKLNK